MKPKIASTKTNGKKRQLAKETLRALNGAELGQVAGGSANQVFGGGGGAGGFGYSLRALICTGVDTAVSGPNSYEPGDCGGGVNFTTSGIAFGGH